jgi:hypothetical protein
MGWLASASILVAAVISMTVEIGYAAAGTPIENPKTFVSDVYRQIVESEQSRSPYSPPDDVYSPHLQRLFASYRKRTGGQVGYLDFDFWVNAQDSKIENMSVTSSDVDHDPDRKVIVAKFMNGGPQEIEFSFKRMNGSWWLDEVRSLKRPRWVLSKLLRCD